VKNNESATWFHIHTAAACAWSHVGRVEKNPHTTPEQAKKNIAGNKSNQPHLQSCGIPKKEMPT
jgi:hypothetical protein